MKEVSIEVIGVEPPCPRCRAAMKTVEEVVSKLGPEFENVKVCKLNIASREVVQRYGVLLSPALSVNGVVKIVGRVPSEGEVEKILREAARE